MIYLYEWQKLMALTQLHNRTGHKTDSALVVRPVCWPALTNFLQARI